MTIKKRTQYSQAIQNLFDKFIKYSKSSFLLLQEGSIGTHLVIRPIPPRIRGSVISRKNKNATDSDTINDDEMFLDQDGELSSEVAIDTGLPIRRNKTILHHIIFRKKVEDDDGALSDYGIRHFLFYYWPTICLYLFIKKLYAIKTM